MYRIIVSVKVFDLDTAKPEEVEEFLSKHLTYELCVVDKNLWIFYRFDRRD